jgi:glyoxylase-like metal-dependent hydrolase (beta-lactamase superfamily II)
MTDMSEKSEQTSSGAEASPVIACVPVGALQANCYLVTCPQTRATLIVDPGAEPERILAQLRATRGIPIGVLHTHGHFDHIAATETVLAGLGARLPLSAHQADRYLYDAEQRAMGVAFGYPQPAEPILPDVELADGGTVVVGNLRLWVVHTPGHTPGSVSLVCGDVCLSGDTLFRRGIGRTDLLGGDEEAIYESIQTRLYALPPETRVYPGHGPATTIGEERRANPFVRG